MTPKPPDRDRDAKDAESAEPKTPEPTPWEKFVETTKRVLAVPKAEIDKREAAWRKQRAKKRPP